MNRTTVGKLSVPVTERDHTQGPDDAPVTLVEYGDYECSYCQQAYRVVKELREEFDDRVRFVFRNFPLTQGHSHAQRAAEAAEAAAAQGSFWAMHDLFYEHQDALEAKDLRTYAGELGLEVNRFKQALTERTYEDWIQEDVLGGARSGVNGTPTFFINGDRYDEQWDIGPLRVALEDAAEAEHTE